jgi:hypothetical protein
VDDLSAAGAREPDKRVVAPTIQVTAALVLSDEDHQGVEAVRHGAGIITTAPETAAPLFCPPNPPIPAL